MRVSFEELIAANGCPATGEMCVGETRKTVVRQPRAEAVRLLILVIGMRCREQYAAYLVSLMPDMRQGVSVWAVPCCHRIGF
jgi:hypothetical protein